MTAGREIAVIGATLDLGQRRRGVDMGPSAIRYAVSRTDSSTSATSSEITATSRRPCPRRPRAGRAREIPPRDQGHVRAHRGQGRRGIERRRAAARPRGRSFRRRHAGRPASVHGSGRGADRRARRHEHAGDDPERQRARYALAAALGLAGEAFESDAWPLPALDARRVALPACGRPTPANASCCARSALASSR